jgi:hypothetical protein
MSAKIVNTIEFYKSWCEKHKELFADSVLRFLEENNSIDRTLTASQTEHRFSLISYERDSGLEK